MKPKKALIRFFLILSIFITGLLFVFLPPPFQKPDEYAHFKRSLMISKGVVFCNADTKTISISRDVADLIENRDLNRLTYDANAHLNATTYINHVFFDKKIKELQTTRIDHLCSYPVLSYIPQALMLFIASYLPLNAYLLFFLGRLVIYLTCITILLLLYKKSTAAFLPVLFFTIALPMTLHQMTSYSYDALHITTLMLYASYLFYLIKKTTVSGGDMGKLAVLLLLFLLMKPGGYEFLALTLYLISPHKIFPKKPFMGLIILSLTLVLVFSLTLLARIPLYHTLSTLTLKPPLNPEVQLQTLLNPLFFLALILKTSFHNAWFYTKGFIGIFGWLEYGMNLFAYFLYSAVVISYLSLSKNRFQFNRVQKIIVLIACASTYIFLIAINFISWTPVGSKIANGVQGRYFIPLFPFLLAFFSSLRKQFIFISTKYIKYLPYLTITFQIVIAFFVATAIISRYF